MRAFKERFDIGVPRPEEALSVEERVLQPH